MTISRTNACIRRLHAATGLIEAFLSPLRGAEVGLLVPFGLNFGKNGVRFNGLREMFNVLLKAFLSPSSEYDIPLSYSHPTHMSSIYTLPLIIVILMDFYLFGSPFAMNTYAVGLFFQFQSYPFHWYFVIHVSEDGS